MRGEGERSRPPAAEDPDLKKLERSLAQALRSHCPPPHTLGEYRLGLLSEVEAARTARHVDGCPFCQGEMELLDRFLDAEEEALQAEEVEPDAGLTLREQIVRWGEALTGLTGVGSILGGPGLPSAAGLRGGPGQTVTTHGRWSGVETGASLGLTFSSDDAMVALQARPGARGRYDLLALVTPLNGSPNNLPVWLRRGTTTVASTRTDPAGNAVFKGLPAGSYDLAVQHGTLRVWVKGIRLGPGADPAEGTTDVPKS